MFDRKCSQCGTQFETEAARGLCPRCLVQTAIKFAEAAPDASTPEDIAFAADQSSTIEATELSSYAKVQRLGDYELLDQIGIGGMGVVYKARQLSLNRVVALKMLLAGEYASPAVRQRFRAEAEAAAGLRHPNIVAIYETGELEGGLYFSMDLVAGRTLADMVRGTPVPPRQAAVYLKKIATAVHYAHQKGILHRDLKPSNVLIDEADEPRITDFGLAKRFDSASLQPNGASATVSPPSSPQLTELTSSGQVLGSPNFMPPEQASPKWGATGPWSDVYGLGAIFYCLLTGRPPFHASSVTETIDQVLNSEPAALRVLNPSVPVDLETICLKCLAKEPARRYESAQELAAELERYLDGEPIRARPIGPVGRAWRWCRRKPALASLGAGLAFLLLVIIVGSPITIARIERERQRATTEARNNARNLYVSDMSLGFRVLEENHVGQVRDILARHLPKQGEPDLRGWEWRYLWQASRGDEEFTLGPLSNTVYDLVFSPDGKLLAAGDYSGIIKVWDTQSRLPVATLDPEKGQTFRVPTALRFSSDARQLAVGLTRYTSSNLFEVWDTTTWQRLPTPILRHPSDWIVVSSSLSPDVSKLATATQGSFALWDVQTGLPILEGAENFVSPFTACSNFSLDGRILAYHSDGTIFVWDLVSHKQVASIVADSAYCRCLALTHDGRLLAAGYPYDGTIQIWALPEARLVTKLGSAQRWVHGLCFSPDAMNLASAGTDRTIVLSDCRNWKPIQILRGHQDEVWRVSYSPDGKWLASGAKDKTVKLWKTGPAAQKIPFVSYPPDMYPNVWRVAYPCRYGDRFMMARSNGTFRIFSKYSLQMVGEYRLPVTNLVISQISPDGRQLACWCEDEKIRVFATESLEQKAVFETTAKLSRVLTFSPDGRVLVGCTENRMWAWGLESQKDIMRDDETPWGGVLTVVFSPDGRWFTRTQNGSSATVVWDIETKRKLALLPSRTMDVQDAAIDPSRKYVVTVGDEDHVSLWDPIKQIRITSLRGLSTSHHSVAFSPDGQRLATGGGTFVMIWDMNTRREVGILKSPYGPVVWLEFLSDGDTLLVATETGVFSCRAPSFEEIARAER